MAPFLLTATHHRRTYPPESPFTITMSPLLKPIPVTLSPQPHRIPLEEVPRCEDLWYKDGDVIIWAEGKQGSVLFCVHCRVLKESRAKPFCTVVDCDYPSPGTSGEAFLDGVWVLKYDEQDPVEIMCVIEWMYERP